MKVAKAKFNQVNPDQSQEWLNGTGKKGGGIVGITKTVYALAKWAPSFNLRAHIAADTRQLYHLMLDESVVHKEASKSRKHKDSEAEDKVKQVLERFGVFEVDRIHGETLQNIATKDQATEDVTNSLLCARHQGQKKVEVCQRKTHSH